jgi:glycosyltransferase involved in cell wall biosynthesis
MPKKIAIDGREITENSAGKGRYITELVHHISLIDSQNQYIVYGAQAIPYSLPSNFTVLPISNRLAVAKDIKNRKCDLFFAPTSYLSAILSPVPTIITIHDLALFITPKARPALKTLIAERLLLGLASQKARNIIAVSNSTKQDLIRLFHVAESKITVTPLGYDPAVFMPANNTNHTDTQVLERHNITSAYLLFIGTLEPRKNINGIVEAYSKLSPDIQKTYTLLIGGKKGWFYESIFAKVKEYKLEHNVLFLGRVPDNDLPALYRNATLSLFPSFYEGFGLPILEALACGTPVITANNSSLPEVVGNAGLLIDADDTQELSDA